MSGRTVWFPKDAAWWRRARIIEVGQEHGPAGPAIVDWLTCEAKSQGGTKGHDGTVKTGYAAVAHGTFTTPDQARDVIRSAVEIGLLDDFNEQGRTFTCRVSGWRQDVELPLAATRRKQQRDAQSDEATTDDNGATQDDTDGGCRDLSPNVAERRPTGHHTTPQDNNKEVTALSSKLDVEAVFTAWKESTGKHRSQLDEKRRRRIRLALKSYPVEDVLDAVRGWQNSPHHTGQNETATVYNDLDLLLRDAAHIERFRDLARGGGRVGERQLLRMQQAVAEAGVSA